MPAPKAIPLTPAQLRENTAFLKELRRTGNAREAARRIGAHRAKFTKRRARHPEFAFQWDAALALAQTELGAGAEATHSQHAAAGPTLLRRADGRLQLRRTRRDGIDHESRTRFLTALSASANVRLAAKAAGFSHASFYHHKRRDPVFAREWRQALEEGYCRLEEALLAGWSPDESDPSAWQDNAPPAIPPMTAAEAMQLLYLHQKEARLWETPLSLRRRPGESCEARDLRMEMMAAARESRAYERSANAERALRRQPQAAFGAPEPALPVLPDLAQVTGWSKASGKPAHHEGVALFGGWRLGDERRR